jgi:hypothetical protein
MSYPALTGLTIAQNLTFANYKVSKCSSSTRDYAVSVNKKK